MTTAVLTLRGLELGRSDRMADFLGGFARRHTHIVVDYGASLLVPISTGANRLDAAITTALDMHANAVVVGHSRGATVAGEWLKRNADRGPSPERLRFILLGNPQRRFGGDGKGDRTPDNTRYRVDDITRAGDRWGNNDNYPGPDVKLSLLAKLVALFQDPHARYEDVDPERPGVLRARVGNTAYWVSA